MRQPDRQSEIEASHEYEVPDAPHCKLDALPAFLGQGWVKANHLRGESRPLEGAVYEAKLDNGAWIQFATTVHKGSVLKSLPESNAHHVQARDEAGRGPTGETLIAGDFYIDRRQNEKWTGRDWKTLNTEIRVRRRPEAPKQTTVVLSAENVDGITVNHDGSVDIDEEYIDEGVEVTVINTTEEQAQ